MASADNDDWKPNNRPKSTLALNFSNDLDNTFGMSNTDSGLDGLAKAVEQKYSPLPLYHSPTILPYSPLPYYLPLSYRQSCKQLTKSPLLFFPRKQALDSQSAELEALNARLKETEERLQKKANGNNPQAAAGAGAGKKVTTPRKTFSPTAQHQQQQKLDAFSSSSLSSSTMNYWRSGGGGGSQNETTTTGGGAPQTPSEMTRDMPGGFDGH